MFQIVETNVSRELGAQETTCTKDMLANMSTVNNCCTITTHNFLDPSSFHEHSDNTLLFGEYVSFHSYVQLKFAVAVSWKIILNIDFSIPHPLSFTLPFLRGGGKNQEIICTYFAFNECSVIGRLHNFSKNKGCCICTIISSTLGN